MFRFLLVLAVSQVALSADYDYYQSGAQYESSNSLLEKVRPLANSWTPGRNPHPPQMYQLGARRDNLHKYRLPVGIRAGVHHVDLPEQFDARDKWPQCPSLREIRNQGCCGSCWAISAASTMSDRWCIHHKDNPQFSFGSFDLLACCHSCGEGCEGGWLGPAWTYWVNRGVSSGGPYNSNRGCHSYPAGPVCPHDQEMFDTPKCARKCQASYNVTDNAVDRRFGRVAYSVANDEERIKEEIFLNGPVQASFDVYSDFKLYKSGVYRHVIGFEEGGHAVKVIGWGVENGVKYWLVANSWGEEWGEKGYFKIVRGENHCNFEADINAGLPHYDKRTGVEY